MSDDEEPLPPPPLHFGLAGAGIFSVAAWTASISVAALLLGWASVPTALAIGMAAGFGGIGTLLARRIPAPADLRIGLRGFAPRLLPALLLLIPAVLLASEIDNLVQAFWPDAGLAPDAATPEPALEPGAPPPDPGSEGRPEARLEAGWWLIAEAVIGMVLLRPVVEEFFFRGVILQGLVERHGARVAVLATALLSGLAEAGLNLPLGSTIAASALAQGLFMGALLGWVRLVSGSLLAPILVQILTRGVGGLAVLATDWLSIAGFNAPGANTPIEVLVPALAAVALGLLWMARSSRGSEVNGVFPLESK